MNKSVNDLTERITVTKRTTTKTAHGYTVRNASTSFQIWANVVGYNAQYVDGKLENRNNVSYHITCRYRTDIYANDTEIYRGKTLTIMNEPVAIDGGKRFIMFNAEELVENG